MGLLSCRRDAKLFREEQAAKTKSERLARVNPYKLGYFHRLADSPLLGESGRAFGFPFRQVSPFNFFDPPYVAEAQAYFRVLEQAVITLQAEVARLKEPPKPVRKTLPPRTKP